MIHGAWHGSWCWQRLGDVLDERRVPWLAIDLPTSSGEDSSIDLTADVSELRRFSLDRGPLVLVAHSYGGAVAVEAAPSIEGLRGIVYLAALVPRPGQTVSDVSREYGLRSALDECIRREDDFLRLDPPPAARALYGDCDEETRQWAISQVGTQTLASFRTPRTSGVTPVATTYVICGRDEALPPEVQAGVAARCDEVVLIDSDHSPFLSRPALIADLLHSKYLVD